MPSPSALVSSLTDAFSCPICHCVLEAPVLLPCDHLFCSLCIRRHLSTHSLCPHPHCKQPATSTSLVPLRPVDRALQPLRAPPSVTPHAQSAAISSVSPPPPLEPLTFFSHKDPAVKSRYIQRLRRFGLSTKGSVDVLAARDKELVLRWNANLDSGLRCSPAQIAHHVTATERHRQREVKRRAHASSVAFFATKKTHHPQQNESHAFVPEEGDSFDTLIRKVRARNAIDKANRQRRDAEKQENDANPEPNGNARNRHQIPVVSLIEPPTPPSVPPSPVDSRCKKEDNWDYLQLGGDWEDAHSGSAIIREGALEDAKVTATDSHMENVEQQVDAAKSHDDSPLVPVSRKRPRPLEHPVANAQSAEEVKVEVIDLLDEPLQKSSASVEGGAKGGKVKVLSSGTVVRGTERYAGDTVQQTGGASLNGGLDIAVGGNMSGGEFVRTGLGTSPYFSTPGAVQRRVGFAEDVTPPSNRPALQDLSQRETQALPTPNSNEKEGPLVYKETGGCVGPPAQNKSPVLGGDVRINPSFLNSFARSIDGKPSGAGITEEQRQRIERNRQAAIERKRKYMEKQRQRRFGQMRQPDL